MHTYKIFCNLSMNFLHKCCRTDNVVIQPALANFILRTSSVLLSIYTSIYQNINYTYIHIYIPLCNDYAIQLYGYAGIYLAKYLCWFLVFIFRS